MAVALAIMIGLIFTLNGCQSDQKQAAKIQKIIEEAATFEKDFATNQTELNELRENARLIYIELINLNINDKDSIKQKIEEGYTYTEQQQLLVKDAKENYQKAYATTLKIEKNINKIKDDDQKNQATLLLTIMNERKKLIGSYFEHYYENLKLQNTFYQHFEKENINLESLNEQINMINERTQEMGEIIQAFNQYTQQFIEAEKNYYQMN